jgi:integrase
MPARPVGRRQRPWNKGLLVGQKKPLEPKHVWSIRVRLEIARSKRDLAIFNLAIDSKLRGCDLVKLRLEDICSRTNVRRRATIVQQKTGRPVQFEISEQSRNSVEAWLPIQVRDISFPADFMQVLIFQPANMPGWCIAGLKASA